MGDDIETYATAAMIERKLALKRAERQALLLADAQRPRIRREEIPMRHRASATAILFAALVAALVFAAGLGPVAALQQGTPATGGSGITTEVLGGMEAGQAPGQMLSLLRVTFAPGSRVAAHTHPGATIYHIAAGTLQFTLQGGAARLVRAVNGTPAAAHGAAEALPIGEEITLTAGDTVYYDGSAVQIERNASDAPAVVLISNLRGVNEPARKAVASTPAAS
jgi:quercetin dioxygenase-like cupin family protein